LLRDCNRRAGSDGVRARGSWRDRAVKCPRPAVVSARCRAVGFGVSRRASGRRVHSSSGQTIDEILARLIPGQTALAGDSARVPRGERRIVACDPLRSAL